MIRQVCHRLGIVFAVVWMIGAIAGHKLVLGPSTFLFVDERFPKTGYWQDVAAFVILPAIAIYLFGRAMAWVFAPPK